MPFLNLLNSENEEFRYVKSKKSGSEEPPKILDEQH